MFELVLSDLLWLCPAAMTLTSVTFRISRADNRFSPLCFALIDACRITLMAQNSVEHGRTTL